METRLNCFCLVPIAASRKYRWAVTSCRRIPVLSNQLPLFETLEWCWTPNWRCATTFHEQHKPAFSIYVGCVRFVIHSVVMSHSAGRCTRLLASWLLQCCAGQFTGDYTSIIAASSPCRRSTGEWPTTKRPRYVGTQGAPLAADCSTNRVQTVPACPQVDRRSSTSVFEKPSWLPSQMFHRSQRFAKLWRGTLSYQGLASSSERGRFPSLLHKRGIVFQLTSKRCVLLLHSSALWKLFCSGRHTMFDFSAFTYRFYSQTVPVLSFFSVPDTVMRRRSIFRRHTKSIVVFVFVFG